MDAIKNILFSQEVKTNERNLVVLFLNTTAWDCYTPQQSGINEMKSSESILENTNAKNSILAFSNLIDAYIQYSQNIYSVRANLDTAYQKLLITELIFA